MDNDDYERRFLAAVAETKSAGIWFSNAVPPYVRMLRKIGKKPLPPHYAPLRNLFIKQAIAFSVIWGLFMWLIVWEDTSRFAALFMGAVLAGILFGAVMTGYLSFSRKANNLSRWEDL